jgi:hypothetical protein
MLSIPCVVQSNTIHFHLPAYPGFDYVFILEQGAKRDTVATGTFDQDGKTSLTIPKAYANYRGVGKLLFPNDKGALVNMIVNGENNVTVSTPPRTLEIDKLVYTHSPENEAIGRFTATQVKLIERYRQVSAESSEPYSVPQVPFLSPEKEQQQIETQYAALNAEIRKSPLYAARIMEIIQYLTSTGTSLTFSQEELQQEQDRFITERLDFNDLYTSGFWTTLIYAWYENNMTRGDSLLTEQSRRMINRTETVALNRELTQALINTFSRYGREDLLPEIITGINMPLKGHAAPPIETGDSTILPKNSLIIFYETGCGTCHNELENMKRKYPLLHANQVRVISIASDMDDVVFFETADKFPWSDKFCDLKGFDGVNFRNYGIVGTPTLILVDAEGIVRGRYVQLSEFLKE